MADNYFDQFDESAVAQPEQAPNANFFDQFDETPAPDRGAGAFASPALADADPSRAPSASIVRASITQQSPRVTRQQAPNPYEDFGGSLLQGHEDAQTAYRQGASAVVRNRKGEFMRPVLGEIEDYDFGTMIRLPPDSPYIQRGRNGEAIDLIAPDRNTVILRDPESGRMMAFLRDPKIDNPDIINRIATAILPNMATNAPTRIASSGAVPMAVQRGAALGFPVTGRSAQINERVRDAAAFAELGLAERFFPPAFRSKGAAGFAQTVENMPVIGNVVKAPKMETEAALAEVQASLVNRLGGAATDEAAGRVLQTGLDRFRNAGVAQLEPSVVAGLGVEPMAAVPRQPLMSAEASRRVTQAAPIRTEVGGGMAQTSRGAAVQSARPLEQTYAARRGAEDLSDAELAAFVGRERAPVSTTSFAARQEALFDDAWRTIPAQFRINDSRNPQRLAAANTRAALAGIDSGIASQIGGQSRIGGELADRLRNVRSHFDLGEIRAMRTEVGRAIGTLNPFQTTLNGTQLKQLYGALSRDIEVGLMDIANRAYIASRLGGNRPDRVAVEAAQRADEALRKFRTADRYTRMGMARMDKFSRILGADSPEAAMRVLATKMKEGQGIDRGTIRAVAESLRPDERNQILGYLVANMGRGRPGAAEAERVWNIHSFATDWNRNKAALALLARNVDPAVRRGLDRLAQVSERMKFYETTRNYSGSAYAGIPALSVMTAIGSGSATGFMSLLAQIGGVAAIGKFLTTPRYLDWMVKAGLEGAVPRAAGPQVGGSQIVPGLANLDRLRRVAANDNQLGPVVTQALDLMQRQRAVPQEERPEGQRQQ